jgi:glycosyltransferase involved in cell wall biosynthesis
MNAPIPLSQATLATDAGPEPGPITQPYLLAVFGPPFYLDGSGRRWVDALWAKDLVEHTRYIRQLILAAPLAHAAPPANAVAVDELELFGELVCVDLPRPRNIVTAFFLLPRTCAKLWRALERAVFVHGGVAGWPLAEAWILVPLLLLRRRPLYINVESAFWRLVPGEAPSLARRVRAVVAERLNRACVEFSDICTFTHEGYRRGLLRRNPDRGHVIEASWIDESNLLDDAQLSSVIDRRRRDTGRLRLVFVGRLTREKGLVVLLDAVTAALRDGVWIELDIFGEGPLTDHCVEQIRMLGPTATVRLRGTLPYDQRFFETLRGYDLLVAPTISDEQPRVIFDAYAQGVPVIASRTSGLAQCVDDNVTGFLVPAGDVRALQTCVTQLADRPATLSEMSLACVTRARGLTHRQMHRKRWRLLVARFPELMDAA